MMGPNQKEGSVPYSRTSNRPARSLSTPLCPAGTLIEEHFPFKLAGGISVPRFIPVDVSLAESQTRVVGESESDLMAIND